MADKAKTIFLFSGQGSQYKGMGKEFYDTIPECAKVMELGSDILGFDLAAAIFDGDEKELSRTIVSQPAILAMSLMALEAAKSKGIEASAVAGHSLGEYAAMAASGMLTYENAFRAIKYRSEAMDRAAQANPGGMAAVLGLKADVIEDTCKEIVSGGDYVTPVNYNSPVQTVIAGTAAGIEKAKEADVPIHRDDDLAKTLSKLEIGDLIPVELYEVVAEILVFVDRMDKIKAKIDAKNT